MAESKQINPLQNLFSDIKKILEFIEVKDDAQATEYETAESRNAAEMWMNAMIEADTYITYREYWTFSMFQEVQNNIKYNDFKSYIENPFTVPFKFQYTLREKGRSMFLSKYIEKNEYYRMLNGLPPINASEDEYVYLSEDLCNKFHCSNIPIHEQSEYVQNSYITTNEYSEIITKYPDKKYLKYLGSYKIDIFAARKANDFDIIRYPSNRSDINPNLLNIFASLYADYREYVMVVLYNNQFEDMYANYRSFMGVLIMSFVLMQIGNKAVEAVHTNNYLDDTILHMILSMYGIPDSLLLTNEIRRNLATNMLKLVREKGTDEVYYDLIDILGYQNVVVSKLMLMKGQQFSDDKATDNYQPYFLQINLKDENPYDSITSGKATRYEYNDIISKDPFWWDDEKVHQILQENSYTIADSKYITIEAEIQQMKYAFESIYFTRLILDNQSATQNFMIEVPELFGTEMMSIYDLIVYVLCATCMVNGLNGDIITNEQKLLSTAGFNFDLDQDKFNEFLLTTKYIDLDRLNKFINNLSMTNKGDINRLFNDVMYPLREWLENKIASATERREYLEYEAIYRALFTYDINHNPFQDDFEMPIETIRKSYNISKDDMEAFKHFYPQTITGERIVYDEYNASNNTSRYKYPFGGANHPIDWYVSWIDESNNTRYLYFHDILNSNDIRWIKDEHGDLLFLKYEDGEVGFELDNDNINKALSALQSLDSKQLNTATFQEFTSGNGVSYNHGQKLPASIRAEIYKKILIDKFTADIDGLGVPPTTYIEYLRRKNKILYNKLIENNRFERDKESWMNDVMTVILAIESELSIHMKYFEQSVLGEDLFFKPLITLIKHFKSSLVQLSKTGLKYIFDDKMDIGGNSNMLKLFDQLKFTIHFSTIQSNGYESQFGLYDAEHIMKHHIMFMDKLQCYKQTIGQGFAAEEIDTNIGSMHLSDEVKFYKNGKPIDDIAWLTSNERLNDDDHQLIVARSQSNIPIDFNGWQDYITSYIPNE